MVCYYFDTKIKSERNSFLDEEWLFTGRLEVGSVPEMIDKEVLDQFTYNPV